MKQTYSEASKSPLEKAVDTLMSRRPEYDYRLAVEAIMAGRFVDVDSKGLWARHEDWTAVLSGDLPLSDVRHQEDREQLGRLLEHRKRVDHFEARQAFIASELGPTIPNVVQRFAREAGFDPEGDKYDAAQLYRTLGTSFVDGGAADFFKLAASLKQSAQEVGSLSLLAASEVAERVRRMFATTLTDKELAALLDPEKFVLAPNAQQKQNAKALISGLWQLIGTILDDIDQVGEIPVALEQIRAALAGFEAQLEVIEGAETALMSGGKDGAEHLSALSRDKHLTPAARKLDEALDAADADEAIELLAAAVLERHGLVNGNEDD